jgi:pilus assembly protein Flp/PilA
MSRLIKIFLADVGGATAIEYGLIVSMIFLAILTSLYTFQLRMGTMFQTIDTAINTAVNN